MIDTSISELFSWRVAGALERAGFDDVAAVMDYIEGGGKLLDIEGIGPAGADEINQALMAPDDDDEIHTDEAPPDPPPNTERQEEPESADEPDKSAEDEPVTIREPAPVPLYKRRCVNCGVRGQVWRFVGSQYRCETCGHEWGNYEEQSPFRKIQRGEL